MTGSGQENGWHERLLLFQMEEQAKDHTQFAKQLSELEKSVARLQVRAGIWGALAGVIPAVAALLWGLLK